MKIEDIHVGHTYASRIGGEPFTVRQVRPEAGTYAACVGYTRGHDNAMRSVTPADFIEMARLYAEPPGMTYECTGCGRHCADDAADLAALRSEGKISCCPERKMQASPGEVSPIPMILHCPCCGMQHVDESETHEVVGAEGSVYETGWTNPPHRSHLCKYCFTVWRPADVPTTGVASIMTRGRDDTEAFRTAGNRPMTERVATVKEGGRVEWEYEGQSELPNGTILVAILPRR